MEVGEFRHPIFSNVFNDLVGGGEREEQSKGYIYVCTSFLSENGLIRSQ